MIGFFKNLIKSQLEAAKRRVTIDQIEDLEAKGYDIVS